MSTKENTTGDSWYKDRMRSLVAESFGRSGEMSEQDTTWANWLSLSRRDRSDLLGLLASNVHDAFKARAVCILAIPDLTLNPFLWSTEPPRLNYLMMRDEWNPFELSPVLQKWFCAFVRITVEHVGTKTSDSRFRDWFRYQNKFILTCLHLLPADSVGAETLFHFYQINDPEPFWNMDDASGYNPFRQILVALIPEKWKERADRRIRETILAEEMGELKPREDWEGALVCYARHVESCLFGESFPYNTALFASQLEFLLRSRVSISSLRASNLFRVLEADEYRDLRHAFAKRIQQHTSTYNAFSIYDDETYAVAQYMLAQFSEDTELCDRLRTLIAEADTKKQAEHTRDVERTQHEREILEHMQ